MDVGRERKQMEKDEEAWLTLVTHLSFKLSCLSSQSVSAWLLGH